MTPLPRAALAAAGLLLAATVAVPVHAAPPSPCDGNPAVAAPATYDHVVWIWMENKSALEILGSPLAPYENTLLAQCGYAANYRGVTHPSLPNYLAGTGGSTFGVTDDASPAAHPIADPSVFSQVSDAGRQWRSYQEAMPSNCALSSSGTYAVKHNPAAYFTGIRTDCAAWDVPMGTPSAGAFHDDLANDTLPAYAFVTPDLCNDTHDCPVSTGDAWLQSWVPQILASAAYATGRTALVVTWDEDDGSPLNLVSAIVVAPSVVPGTVAAQQFDHYSLLRTTEEMLGLPTTLANAATSMRAAFHL